MSLPALIREHGDEIEADLGFRGIDLLDMYRGTLSPRKVALYIRALPPDSATRIAMNGGQWPWSQTDYILADLVDATLGVAYQVAHKDVPKHNRSPYPDPYPRPGAAVSKPVVTGAALLDHRQRTSRG